MLIFRNDTVGSFLVVVLIKYPGQKAEWTLFKSAMFCYYITILKFGLSSILLWVT